MDHAELITAAVDASRRAYAPYSKFRVGAALLGKSGNVYTGCNVENASYGLSNCAERTAVFNAVSKGEVTFAMIAVVTEEGTSPCGACRQVLNEFAPDLTVLIADTHGALKSSASLKDLLPQAFGPEIKKS